MFCKTCGATLPEGARFCADCGTPVQALPELAPEPELPRAAELPELVPDPEPPKPAPLLEMPEPTAPMYTPAEPEPACAEPVYAEPVYAEAVPANLQSEVDSIFNWGVAGLVCAFLFTILGIIFSAIAMSKARRMQQTYGDLPQRARTGRGLGIAGLIVSIVLTVLGLLMVIAVIAFAASIARDYVYYY